MFFVSWGAHSEVKDLGSCGSYHCERCNKDGEFHALFSYRVRHAYWIFRWVTGKERHTACGNCGAVYPAAQDSFGAQAERDAIPFIDRRGWTIGAGAIGSLLALGSVAVAADGRENETFLAAPHIGDVYEVNAAKLMAAPDKPNMYSAMRVVEVRGESVALQLGKTYFEDLRGIQDEMRGAEIRNAEYYMEEKLVFSRAQLKAFYVDETILDVVR